MTPSILIVDDEQGLREMLEILLSREGYNVPLPPAVPRPWICLKNRLPGCPDRHSHAPNGRPHSFERNQGSSASTEVIMISAYADQETAIEAMNEGAYDFFPKPFNNKELKQVIKDALAKAEGGPSPAVEKGPFLFPDSPADCRSNFTHEESF